MYNAFFVSKFFYFVLRTVAPSQGTPRPTDRSVCTTTPAPWSWSRPAPTPPPYTDTSTTSPSPLSLGTTAVWWT